ncbi:MAG: alkaline phosphatase family protein [Thermoproteales archaeon]|nr:alkaline phosphatase family protein [Thermoproteales archaeon]
MVRKLLVIGLDCVPPNLLYKEFKEELPNISMLLDDGYKAEMKTTNPPITIPAWAVMTTGKSPGELGIYGFRHRIKGKYNDFYIVNSRYIKTPAIWDVIGRKDLKSIVVGVPPSYPPKPIKGYMVSGFITPGPESRYTFPITLKRTLEKNFGKYIFDVVYRSEDKDRIVEELWKMTIQHFKIYSYLASKDWWTLMMFVEIGTDRVHHAFWGYMDKEHHKYTPGNKYEKIIEEYYKLVDEKIGELLKNVPKDTVISIVSDHGAKRMKGAFVINQWMIKEGYMKLQKSVGQGTELKDAPVDWKNTLAWGWGGYYARIFLNVKGREPYGIIEPEDYEHYRDELKEKIQRIRGPNGEEWKTKVYRPEELYPVVRGDPPDLIVYFDDLYWRSAGTLGWPTMYLKENDRGPDDAVHDWIGVFTLYDPENTVDRKEKRVDIQDISKIYLETILGETDG